MNEFRCSKQFNMASTKNVSIFKISIFILLIVVSSSIVNGSINPLAEPCLGAGSSKVRALNIDSTLAACGEHIQCVGDVTDSKLSCSFEKPYFDAESQECVAREEVCFHCPKTPYALVSVPHTCKQFILCINNKPIASSCPDGLVFDGRPGVHQCNFPPNNDPNECFKEDKDDFESKTCPPIVGSVPFFEANDKNSL